MMSTMSKERGFSRTLNLPIVPDMPPTVAGVKIAALGLFSALRLAAAWSVAKSTTRAPRHADRRGQHRFGSVDGLLAEIAEHYVSGYTDRGNRTPFSWDMPWRLCRR